MSKMAYKLVLLEAELKDIQTANKVLSKRRRAKKTRLQQGGSLSFQEAEDLVAVEEVNTQINAEVKDNKSRTKEGHLHLRCCRNCGNPSYNARTCKEDITISEEENSK
jgi:hypothetical protein